MLTSIHEDYLKTIYNLQEQGGRVSTNDLAERLDVRAPTATSMLKRLAEQQLVDYEPYHGVRLTLEGEKIALKIIQSM